MADYTGIDVLSVDYGGLDTWVWAVSYGEPSTAITT